jgi:stage V sporulation protein B
LTSSSPDSQPEGTDNQVGRGYLWLTGAKLWFLVTATLLNIGLPRLLGDPAAFGDYKVVAGFLAVLSMVILAGALQTSSKCISERPEFRGTLRRRAERLAFAISASVALIVFLAAEPIARVLWQDEALAEPVRLASGVILAYGLYATWIGAANGVKNYRTQALFDIGFATLKTGGIIAAVVLGFGIAGIFLTFTTVALLMTAAAFLVIARKTVDEVKHENTTGDKGMELKKMATFMGGVMGFNLTLNLLLQGDVVLLKGLVHEASTDAIAAGQSLGLEHLKTMSAEESTSYLAGLYGAVRNVTMIPYQGIISLTFVIFPILSAATFQSDQDKTQATIHGALRFAVILISLLCGGLMLTDDVLIGMLFGASFKEGAGFLIPMVTGTIVFSLYFVLTSMLTAAGYVGRVLVIGAISAVIHLGAVAFATGLEGTPFEKTLFCAWGSMIGPFVGFLFASFWIQRLLKMSLPWVSILRSVGCAMGISTAILFFMPSGGLVPIILRLLAFSALVVLAWVLTGEIGKKDLQTLKNMLGKNKA